MSEGNRFAPSAPEVGRVIPNALLRLPKRQRLFHAPPPWTKAGEIFFITICCAERNTNQLAGPEAFKVMLAAVEHYARNGKWWVQLFLAMPDHLHALISFPPEASMEKVVRDWKRYVAKQAAVRWQDGFFDHRLRGGESLNEKAQYIRLNPVRAGLASLPEEWPYAWPACAAPETAR